MCLSKFGWSSNGIKRSLIIWWSRSESLSSSELEIFSSIFKAESETKNLKINIRFLNLRRVSNSSTFYSVLNYASAKNSQTGVWNLCRVSVKNDFQVKLRFWSKNDFNRFKMIFRSNWDFIKLVTIADFYDKLNFNSTKLLNYYADRFKI